MKNIKFLAGIVLFLTAFTFTSCDNEPIDPAIDLDNFGGGNAGPAMFKADFSGNTWVASTAQALVGGNYITISGIKPNGEGFGLLVEANSTGTYPANTNILAFTPAGSEYGYWSTNFDNPEENTGSITITNIDLANNTISGTFSFKGYWSDTTTTSILPVEFTNGVETDIFTAEFFVGAEEWLTIAAEDANLDAINVSVRRSVGTGTYPITGNVAVDSAQGVYTLGDTDYDSVSGSVTITSKTSTRIKGTFNFQASDGTTTKSITEGAFDVEYN